MKKRLFSMALALCMILSILPVQAAAAWDEEQGIQVLDLPVVADGEGAPAPQGMGDSVSLLGLIANTTEYDYVYEGQDSFYLDTDFTILEPTIKEPTTEESTTEEPETGESTTEEPAAKKPVTTKPAKNGILQLLDPKTGKVVASSEAISDYSSNGGYVENEEGYEEWTIFSYYISSASFRSSDTQDLTKLPDGTYNLQLVTGSNAEDIYPCEGAVVVVDNETCLLLKEAWINLNIGYSDVDIQVNLYGVEKEDDLEQLSFNLLDASGTVIGSTTGNYRNIHAYKDGDAPYWYFEAELVLTEGLVLEEDVQYTLQLAYTGDKDLYDGVGAVRQHANEPHVEIEDLTVLDPQAGLVRISFQHWNVNMQYEVLVYDDRNRSELIGQYEGLIPDTGFVDVQLGKNGISMPLTSLGYGFRVAIYEAEERYESNSNYFENPYYNLNSSSGGRIHIYPDVVSTYAADLDFTVQGYNSSAYLGKGDVVTLQDAAGNVVATCDQLTELRMDGDSFEFAGTFTFAGNLRDDTEYDVYLNGIPFRNSLYATSTMFLGWGIPLHYYDYDGESETSVFYQNLGVFPVSIEGVNTSGTGVISILDENGNRLFSSGTITGVTGEYDGYLYYDHMFTAEDFAKLTAGNSYRLSFSSGGQTHTFNLGTYDTEKRTLDLSRGDTDSYYIRWHNLETGGTKVPMELYMWTGDLRNLTVEDLDVVKGLSVRNEEQGTTYTVTGFETKGWDDDYYRLELTLSEGIASGYHTVYYNGTHIDGFSVSEPSEEDTTPMLYNQTYSADDCYVEGQYLPADGVYTAKVYDGYTCVIDTFALTWKAYSGNHHRLTYADTVMENLPEGKYQMRVYLDGALFGTVELTVMDMSTPIVKCYDDRYGNSQTTINYSGYYAFQVANAGVYTRLRAAESLEELANTRYDELSDRPSYRLSKGTGEKTVYAQLQTADGQTESDVMVFRFWRMNKDELLDVTVHEDLQGIYGGDTISFAMGTDMQYATAWLEVQDGDGNTDQIALRYDGFAPLPDAFPPSDEDVAVLQSAHPYAANTDETWTYTVNGANSLKVTFSENTRFSYNDYLYVYAGEVSSENQLYRYTSWDLDGETLIIPGDTISLRLTSNEYDQQYGFAIMSIIGSDAVIHQGPAILESSHPYDDNSAETWTYTVEGAETIDVSFSLNTEFESRFDYLWVYAGEMTDQNLVGKYTGMELAGETLHIPGDTVNLKLTSDGSVSKYGFAITSIVDPNAPVEEPEESVPETPVVPEVVLPESDHPFGNYAGYTAERFTHTVEGAEYIAVTFSERTSLSSGSSLSVFTGKDTTGTCYDFYDDTNCSDLAGKTIVLPGDTVTLLLEADSTTCYGFAVTSIVAATESDMEPEDTTGYLHVFTSKLYDVNNWLNSFRLSDAEVLRFYLTDENENIISEVVERSLIFGSPDSVILPWYDGYEDRYSNTASFTVYGYATPNSTVTVWENYEYGNTLGTGMADNRGYFSIQLDELSDGEYYIVVSDSSGETESTYASFTIDTVAPVITSAEFNFGSSGTATLIWGCSDYDVDHFALYQNDILMDNWIEADEGVTNHSYTVAAREDDGQRFLIRAYDYAGNISERTISTADQILPTAPETVSVVDVTTSSITLTWSEGTDNKGVLGYDVYMNGEIVCQETSALTYTATDLEMGEEYTFAVRTRDLVKNASELSPAVTASTVTITVAADMEEEYVADEQLEMLVPVRYMVTSDNEDYTVSVAEAWMEYRLLGSGEDWMIAGLDTDGTGSWSIDGDEDGFLPMGPYELRIYVVDIHNASVVSDPVVVTLARDSEAPTVPGTPAALSHTTDSITFTWTASQDNVGVDRYVIYCDGEEIDFLQHIDVSSFSYTVDGLSMGEHEIGVQAVDFRGNQSAVSSAMLNTMRLEFDSVIDLETQDIVLEDQDGKCVPVWAKFKPEAGYTTEVSVALEYKSADSDIWSTVPLTVSSTDENYFQGSWDVSGDDCGYVTPGKYNIRFAVTDGKATAYSAEQSVMLVGEGVVPVIHDVFPEEGTVHGKTVLLAVDASDNVRVERISISYLSGDDVILLCDKASSGYTQYVWDVSDFESGEYQIRVQVYDIRGNMTEIDRTIVIDTTPPAVPTGVYAVSSSRYIHLMWDTENYELSEDFDRFRVYRATERDGAYENVKNLESFGYFDDGKTAQAGTTYYYYVVAEDVFGNVSDPSEIVSATFLPDNESPVIYDMLPHDGETLRKEVDLAISASDNYRLSTAIFYYRAEGDSKWIEIGRRTADGITSSDVFEMTWNLSVIKEAGTYEIRAEVYDASFIDVDAESGYDYNAPAVCTKTVTILPYSKPVAPVVTAEVFYKKADLSWTYGGSLETLRQFVVYQIDSKGNRTYVTAVKAGTEGRCTVTLPKTGQQTFVVTARDAYGETADSALIALTSAEGEKIPPVAVIGPANLTAAVNVPFQFSGVNSTDNDVIASYVWDFGDGSTGTGATAEHTYKKAGTYTVKLTVTDESGNANTAEQSVAVYDITGAESGYVLATFNVVNAYVEDTPAIVGAEVTIAVKDAQENVTFETFGVTDASGTVTVVVPKDVIILSATANGFMATSRKVEVTSDESGRFTYTVGMTPMNVSMVDGSLTVEEMTYDQIVDAGINITAPDNNHVWKFAAELEFVAAPALPFDIPNLPITGYFDDDGNYLGGFGFGWNTIGGGGGGGGGGGTGLSFNVGVFPISEHFLLVIYGEARWLKEMYNVELLVINNSYVDDITDCEATLTLPEGLSLADMIGRAQNETIRIGTVPHRTSQDDTANTDKVNWYVRGDAEGEYNLTATVTGNNPEPFIKTFTTTEPVKVYAGTALELTIRAEDIAYAEEEYHVQFELKNVSHKPLYNLSFGITGAEQFRVIQIGDDELKTTLTHEDFGSNMTRDIGELKPGESIIIDFYTTTWFKSVLELVELGPLDVGYYLRNVFVTTLEGSSTEIPCKVEIIPSSHGTFFEWVMDEVVDSIEGDVIEILEDKFLGKVPILSTGKKIYEFLHVGDAASRCEISLNNGSFTNSNNLLRSRAVMPLGAISVYTDSKDYQISPDGSTMIINGDAKIYVEGARKGRASMTVKTVTVLDDGTTRENVHTVEYAVAGEVGEAEDLILQAPVVGVTDGKAAVPLAGETLEITFPYVLVDANGNYQTEATNAKWSVSGEDTTGLHLKNGVLTVESCAQGGEYTVALTVGETTATQTVTLTREPSAATVVKLYRNGALLGDSDVLTVPAVTGLKNETFTAKVFDQYGVEMEADEAWNITANTTNVVLVDGVITLDEATTSGCMTLTATVDAVSASVDVAIIDSGELVVETVGATATGASFVLENRTGNAVALQAIAAAYDGNGRMVGFNTVRETLHVDESMDISVTYAENSYAENFKVFVLNPNTADPLTEA